MNGSQGEEVRLECKTLYAWREAVGPHLAAEREGLMVQDEVVRKGLGRFLGAESRDGDGSEWRLIETAGGVASPGPSGTLQCDLYRYFFVHLSVCLCSSCKVWQYSKWKNSTDLLDIDQPVKI